MTSPGGRALEPMRRHHGVSPRADLKRES